MSAEAADLRRELRIEKIWAKHFQAKARRLEEQCNRYRRERDELRRELDRRLVEDLAGTV